MDQILIVVSRREPLLYADFKKALADGEKVTVILDRRFPRRSSGAQTPLGEPRSGDRRHDDISPSLRALGWAAMREASPMGTMQDRHWAA